MNTRTATTDPLACRVVVDTRERGLVRDAVRLHHEALSYRSFITLFGLGFLEQLYVGILDLRLGFLVVAEDEGRLAGFILACEDSRRLMSVVTRRWYRFIPTMLGPLVRKPAILRKLVQTVSYSRQEGSTAGAELVVIAVQPGSRSRGLGRALLRAFEDELIRRKVSAYRVTVHDEMNGANRFYRTCGLNLAHQFRLYDVTWNLYVKKVGAS